MYIAWSEGVVCQSHGWCLHISIQPQYDIYLLCLLFMIFRRNYGRLITIKFP